jgi:hypothetical protein
MPRRPSTAPCGRGHIGRMDEDEGYKQAFGQRLRAARVREGYVERGARKRFYDTVVAAFGPLPGIRDADAYYKIDRGTRVPADPRTLAAIARTAGVSVEWLALGEEVAPAGFVDWLASGGEAKIGGDARKRTFLAAQPVPPSRQPDPAFWDYALVAYERGLRGPKAVAAASGDTAHPSAPAGGMYARRRSGVFGRSEK